MINCSPSYVNCISKMTIDERWQRTGAMVDMTIPMFDLMHAANGEDAEAQAILDIRCAGILQSHWK